MAHYIWHSFNEGSNTLKYLDWGNVFGGPIFMRHCHSPSSLDRCGPSPASCSQSGFIWQVSSLTTSSEYPKSSTSKLRCGSASLFIRIWGTSWARRSTMACSVLIHTEFKASLPVVICDYIHGYSPRIPDSLGTSATGLTLRDDPMTIKRSAYGKRAVW